MRGYKDTYNKQWNTYLKQNIVKEVTLMVSYKPKENFKRAQQDFFPDESLLT